MTGKSSVTHFCVFPWRNRRAAAGFLLHSQWVSLEMQLIIGDFLLHFHAQMKATDGMSVLKVQKLI